MSVMLSRNYSRRCPVDDTFGSFEASTKACYPAAGIAQPLFAILIYRPITLEQSNNQATD